MYNFSRSMICFFICSFVFELKTGFFIINSTTTWHPHRISTAYRLYCCQQSTHPERQYVIRNSSALHWLWGLRSGSQCSFNYQLSYRMSCSDLPEGWSEISEEEGRRLREGHPGSLISDLLRHPTTGLLMPRVFVEHWAHRQAWAPQIPEIINIYNIH